MSKKSKPNAPIVMGDYTAYAVRGPREDGAYYWSAKWWTDSATGRIRTSKVLGWLLRAEATEEVRKLSGAESPDDYAASGEVRTVRDLMETWLAVVETSSKKPSSKKSIRSVAKRIVRHLGDVRLDRLTVDVLDRHVGERLASDAASSSVEAETVHLGAAWRWGHERGFVASEKLRMPKIKDTGRKNNHATPDPEHVALVQATLDERGVANLLEAEWAVAHRILWCTGCRPHEVEKLTWAHVDFGEGTVTVPDDTKTGTRGVPLREDAVKIIREWKIRCGHGGADDPVVRLSAEISRGLHSRLVGTKRKRKPDTLGLCKTLGIPDYTPYGLRRLAVDSLYGSAREHRADVATIASILGHSPAIALKHYRTPTTKDKKSAIVAAGLGSVPVAEPVVIEFPTERKK